MKRLLIILLGIIVFISLAISPSVSAGLTDMYNEKRLLQASVLILSSLFFIYLFTKNKLNIRLQNRYLWSIFFVLISVSIVLSEHLSWALLEIGWYVCLLQLVFVLAYIFQQFPQKFEHYLFLTIISFATLYSIRVAGDLITGFVDPNWPSWPDHTRSVIMFDGENIAKNGFLGFKNVRFFNHLQTWSLPVLICGYIKYHAKLMNSFRGLFFVLITFSWMLAFASGARGTLLSLLISSLVVFLLFRVESKKWFKNGLITCFSGFLLYILIFYVLIPEGSGKALARADSSRRLELWVVAWQAFKSSPIWGLGPMHMANVNGINPITSPHNIYLMWMAEWGFPAFLFGGFIALKNFYRWIQSALIDPSVQKVALTISLIAGLIHSGVSGLLITPLSQLLFALLLGWSIGIYYSGRNETLWISHKNSFNGILKSIPLVLLAVFLFAKVGAMVPSLEESKEKFQDLNRKEKIELFPTSRATIYPRFWEQGFIGINEINGTSKDP